MGIKGSLRGLFRASGQPRWLTVAFAPALVGHGLAGFGLYWDIAWHIDIGRDEQLFTTPHTLILAGLLIILVSNAAGLFVAARDGARLPRSLLAATFSAGIAVIGFPLDEVWHQVNGLDVTLWSPTHVLMVGGGGLSVLPPWFALGEAGVRPGDGPRQRAMHVLAALTLLGALTSFQGEFDFGVPQFQLLYHPVLVVGSAAVVLTAARAVIGRGGAVMAALGVLAFRGALMLFLSQGPGLTAPRTALLLGSALMVEAVAALRPAERGLLPYALLSGAAVGTVGLASEWAWAAAFARHPWTSGMLTEAVLVGLLGSLGGALLGACVAGSLRERLAKPPAAMLAAGAVATLVALLLPLPRTANMSPQAAISYSYTDADREEATVRVVIGPPDAPYAARWWEVLAYQGGGMRIAPLYPGEGSGVYETREAVPVTGDWKVSLRLQRGTDILAAMLRRPADEQLGDTEVALREGFVTLELDDPSRAPDGDAPGWLRPVVLGTVSVLWLAWALLVVRAGLAARAALTPPPAVSQRGGRKLRQG